MRTIRFILHIGLLFAISVIFAGSVQAGVLSSKVGLDSGEFSLGMTDDCPVPDSDPLGNEEILLFVSNLDSQAMGGPGGATNLSFSSAVAFIQSALALDAPEASDRIDLLGLHLPDEPHLDCPLRPS